MGTFAIFALILTTAYVIYYGVVITKDILASRKTAEDNDATETLDTSFMENETTVVTELEPANDAEPTSNPESVPGPEPVQTAADTVNMVEDQMELLQPEFSDPMTDDEYYALLVNTGDCKHHHLMIESHTIHPDGTTEENSVDVPLDEI